MADKKEYIERGALLNFLNAIYEECRLNNDGATSDLVFDVIRHVEDLPAADVAPVVHGYWKWETKIEPRAQNRLYCSVCDNECLSKGNYYVKSKYCPHCGSKMDERKEQT